MPKKLPIIFIITLIFAIMNAIISLNSLKKYSDDQNEVIHSYKVNVTVEKIFSSIRDGELDVREYITTKDQKNLIQYANSQKDVNKLVSSLQNLTQKNKTEQDNINDIKPLIAQRNTILNQAIVIRNSQDENSARQFLEQAKDTNSLERIKPIIQDMYDEENTLLAARTTDATQTLQSTYATIVLANLLGVLLIGISYYFFIRELQIRSALEQRKNDFISMAAHELKTPLTSMNAFVYALKKHTKNIQDTKWIGKLESQIKNQTKLINDLLDNSRMQEGKLNFAFEASDLNKIITDVSETMQANVSHQIIVKGKSKKLVVCDTARIGQVITNLLSNAIKYSPNAKSVIIYVENMRNKVRVSVQDFGIGIPQKDVQNVFNRFYRVEHDKSKRFPGLGLGLYITAEIIKKHKGTLSVKSKEGKGSTFSFTLPYARKIKKN